jgi:hypothetical protein
MSDGKAPPCPACQDYLCEDFGDDVRHCPLCCPYLSAEERAEARREWDLDYAESGVDTPGCDCSHDGMGWMRHADGCAWAKEAS